MNIPQLVDAIPVVQSPADRGSKFGSPALNQRVQDLSTGQIQRWNGAGWVVDFAGAGAPTGMVNAATIGGGVGTIEAQLNVAIPIAKAAGLAVFVPLTMQPYNGAIVNFDVAVRMVAENGDPSTWDVQAYGADPLTVIDATASWNAAIAGAVANVGRVVARSGVYKIATFVFDGNGSTTRAVIVNGSCEIVGKGQVWLKNTTPTGGSVLRVNDNPQTAPVTNVLIEGIGIDGNLQQQGAGIQVFNVQDVTIQRCHFKNFSHLNTGTFSYAIRVEGYGTPANPFVWGAGLPAGFSQRVRVLGNTFEAFTSGGAGTANCVFMYQTDGCLTAHNTMKNCGLAVMTYGPNRRHSVLHNELSDGWDNGIRFEQDVTGDLQRNQGHTVVGNVIRNMTVDGIRLNCSRTTVKGNVSLYNGNTGIKADNSEHLTIEGNECSFNVNRGIGLALATIVGQVSHTHDTIANNDCVSNGGDGILVVGGGANNTTPAVSIVIVGNRCRFNGFLGIQFIDGDSHCQISHNICEQNGNGGVSFAAGIGVFASQLSWGGCTLAFNRCFDTEASPNAKQPIGIWLRPTAGGVTLQRCYCYFNDCSDAQNSGSYFGAAIATNYAVTGTQSGHLLMGTLYRNTTRGVTVQNVGQNLTASDIIVQLDEGGVLAAAQNAAWEDQAFVVNPAVAAQALNFLNGNVQEFNIATNIAVVVAAPSNNPASKVAARLVVTFFNGSGGALTTAPTFATGAGAFLLSAAAVNPAAGQGVTYTFAWSATQNKWRETGRTVSF